MPPRTGRQPPGSICSNATTAPCFGLALIDSARHPNIEIRLFNAWQDRSWFGREFDVASDFERLNRRMHHKQMIVDNPAVIIGGRDLGNGYFGLDPDFNFEDLDVIGVRPVIRQASAVIDRYWNSAWVSKLSEPPSGGPATVNPELRPKSKTQPAEHPSLQALNAKAVSGRRCSPVCRAFWPPR